MRVEAGGPVTEGQFDARITVEIGIAASSAFTLVERKGFGHPDTLADHLAEELSRAYSRWTLEQCGAVLHHKLRQVGAVGRSYPSLVRRWCVSGRGA